MNVEDLLLDLELTGTEGRRQRSQEGSTLLHPSNFSGGASAATPSASVSPSKAKTGRSRLFSRKRKEHPSSSYGGTLDDGPALVYRDRPGDIASPATSHHTSSPTQQHSNQQGHQPPFSVQDFDSQADSRAPQGAKSLPQLQQHTTTFPFFPPHQYSTSCSTTNTTTPSCHPFHDSQTDGHTANGIPAGADVGFSRKHLHQSELWLEPPCTPAQSSLHTSSLPSLPSIRVAQSGGLSGAAAATAAAAAAVAAGSAHPFQPTPPWQPDPAVLEAWSTFVLKPGLSTSSGVTSSSGLSTSPRSAAAAAAHPIFAGTLAAVGEKVGVSFGRSAGSGGSGLGFGGAGVGMGGVTSSSGGGAVGSGGSGSGSGGGGITGSGFGGGYASGIGAGLGSMSAFGDGMVDNNSAFRNFRGMAGAASGADSAGMASGSGSAGGSQGQGATRLFTPLSPRTSSPSFLSGARKVGGSNLLASTSASRAHTTGTTSFASTSPPRDIMWP